MMRRGYLYNLLLLAVILAYVYDVVQESVELNKLADTKRANLRQRKMVEERVSNDYYSLKICQHRRFVLLSTLIV
jgi:hypothetical protein